MSLSDLASLGSFVSGVAVIVTLIFVLLQMRQANLNQRALMQQMRSARTIDTLLKHAEPEIADVLRRAFANDLSMDDVQLQSFLEIQIANQVNWEDSFLQHKMGTLDARGAESDTATLRFMASGASFRVAWKLIRGNFSADYRDYVDRVVAEAKIEQRPSLSSVWKPMMEEELAGRGSSA